MTKFSNIELGQIGEKIACKFYTDNGFNVVAKNWRYSKIGEIDLILRKDYVLVFSEVKTRRDSSFALPCEAVNRSKQNRIIKLAKIFIINNPTYRDFNVRFDVCQILVNNGCISLDLIENAFY